MLLRKVGLALLLAIAIPGVSLADCNLVAMDVQFCKRCTTVIPGSMTRDTVCHGNRATSAGTSSQIAMVGASIVQRPRNGTLRLEGRAFVYTPKKGFVGQDTFKIERDFIKDGELFVIYLQFNMDVK